MSFNPTRTSGRGDDGHKDEGNKPDENLDRRYEVATGPPVCAVCADASRHGVVRYVLDQDPAVAAEAAGRTGRGLIQIWDRRDRCFVELWKSELLTIRPTREEPDPMPSTLHAVARAAVAEGKA